MQSLKPFLCVDAFCFSFFSFIHSFPLFCLFHFLYRCSIFCKMSALVRHRVFLFGKMPAHILLSLFGSLRFFSVPLILLCISKSFLFICSSQVRKSTSATQSFNLPVIKRYFDSHLCVSVLGTDAPAIVNCLHILARSLDARLLFYISKFILFISSTVYPCPYRSLSIQILKWNGIMLWKGAHALCVCVFQSWCLAKCDF